MAQLLGHDGDDDDRAIVLSSENNFGFSLVFTGSTNSIICDCLSRLDDTASVGRISEVDPPGSLCCSSVLSVLIRTTCKGGGASEGEYGVPKQAIC